MALLMLLSGLHVDARFHAVSCPGNRCKVTMENPSGTADGTEAAPGSVTAENKKSAPGNDTLSGADAKRKEQVARYMSVSYPLRQIRITSPYGYRKDPFTGKRKFHNGLDLHARNAEVLSMMAGEVIRTGEDRISGKYVTLRHGGITVSYCHLSRVLACQGQAVKAGEAVGVTGSTGRSTGEHLHITCRLDGKSVNPSVILNYIKAKRRECVSALGGLLEGRTPIYHYD